MDGLSDRILGLISSSRRSVRFQEINDIAYYRYGYSSNYTQICFHCLISSGQIRLNNNYEAISGACDEQIIQGAINTAKNAFHGLNEIEKLFVVRTIERQFLDEMRREDDGFNG